ncbi:hypothetical protein [Calothrix sp. PCC 7507]|uniref:hypothetical protein n=1 Tax=Calothrix sp. PCC 7507 TaxID=99598 RepID=UPI00029F30D8|nr:hypothetical protein [Calothrix sp. PCC 7507]AFY33189.1 hypothetical protein Cal7507_2772 [Calothrix sp. PCC 7507]
MTQSFENSDLYRQVDTASMVVLALIISTLVVDASYLNSGGEVVQKPARSQLN